MSVIRVNGSTTSNFPTGADVSAEVDLGVHNIGELNDVDTTGAATGKILVYNGTTSQFEIGDDTDTGISNVVEDTTPQLGGDLDLNSNDITGTGDIAITGSATFDDSNASYLVTIDNTSNQNNHNELLLKKTTTRSLTQNQPGVNIYLGTEYSSTFTPQHQIKSRRFASEDNKQLQIFDVADDGLSATKLVQFKKNSAWTSSNALVEMQLNGRVDLSIGNGDDMPNSNITTINMDGTTTTSHNMLTGIMDFGTSSIADGAQVTFTADATNDASGDARVGQIIMAYGSSEEDNKIELRIQDHANTTTQSRIELNGEQAEVSVPWNLPGYTVTNLPTTGITSGSMAFCTNETGGAVPVFYDGTDWRRVTDRAVAS